jgi:hypothetical protein
MSRDDRKAGKTRETPLKVWKKRQEETNDKARRSTER